MADFFSEWGVIVAFFIGLGGLGTFIWNVVKGYNKRQDDKEAARLKAELEKEAIIKKDLEIRGDQIRSDAIKTAEEVKNAVEARAIVIKEEIAGTARLLREHNQLLIDNVLKQIKEVDDKVMKMLVDLNERADLTNGNVAKIRNEVQDVKETVQDLKADLIDLWDWKDDLDKTLGIDEKTNDARGRQKRQQDFDRRKQDFDRRKKRVDIQRTEQEQEGKPVQGSPLRRREYDTR